MVIPNPRFDYSSVVSNPNVWDVVFQNWQRLRLYIEFQYTQGEITEETKELLDLALSDMLGLFPEHPDRVND